MRYNTNITLLYNGLVYFHSYDNYICCFYTVGFGLQLMLSACQMIQYMQYPDCSLNDFYGRDQSVSTHLGWSLKSVAKLVNRKWNI